MGNIESGSNEENIIRDLKEMYDADQAMRERALQNDGAIESEEDLNLDRINTERMKAIVNRVGWITISGFGQDASKRAWLLVQHTDHDVAFQEQCLNLMKALPQGEVSQINIAYLEDRVRVNQGRSQLYGTQFFGDQTGFYGPRPIENPELVDERRKEIGLSTMAEYREELRKKYGQ